MGEKGRKVAAAMVAVLILPALPATPASLAPQVPFEQAIKDLANPDSGARLRTVQMLRDAAYPEAAVPLAALVNDPIDQVQFEAIAAELNIFLAEKITARRRVGGIVELRKGLDAEAIFSAGPLAIGSDVVPGELLTAFV